MQISKTGNSKEKLLEHHLKKPTVFSARFEKKDNTRGKSPFKVRKYTSHLTRHETPFPQKNDPVPICTNSSRPTWFSRTNRPQNGAKNERSPFSRVFMKNLLRKIRNFSKISSEKNESSSKQTDRTIFSSLLGMSKDISNPCKIPKNSIVQAGLSSQKCPKRAIERTALDIFDLPLRIIPISHLPFAVIRIFSHIATSKNFSEKPSRKKNDRALQTSSTPWGKF